MDLVWSRPRLPTDLASFLVVSTGSLFQTSSSVDQTACHVMCMSVTRNRSMRLPIIVQINTLSLTNNFSGNISVLTQSSLHCANLSIEEAYFTKVSVEISVSSTCARVT